jgi:glycosyltransferase involved in cell wall biosynthesis
MNLLIVSHTPHFRRGDAVVGWGATVREIDCLARLFDRVAHVAPLHPGLGADNDIAYQAPNVELRPVPPSGGARFADKLGILARAPLYLRTIGRELKRADVVHVRCPANISLLAIVRLAFAGAPRLRWVKYAGDWQPRQPTAWSYAFQRWWLRRGLHRGLVTVNGAWPDQPPHVHTFVNPCLTDDEVAQGRKAAAGKELAGPPRLVFVGRIEADKGVGRALEALARLQTEGCAATLDLVGDGPERPQFERQAEALGVKERARFHGWVARPALAPFYAQSHLMIFPSDSEGWPKVLSEAMAYGVVPVAAAVGSIPQVLGAAGAGRALPSEDVAGFVQAVREYALNPARWKAESRRAVEAAAAFTYGRYLDAVGALLGLQQHGHR